MQLQNLIIICRLAVLFNFGYQNILKDFRRHVYSDSLHFSTHIILPQSVNEFLQGRWKLLDYHVICRSQILETHDFFQKQGTQSLKGTEKGIFRKICHQIRR